MNRGFRKIYSNGIRHWVKFVFLKQKRRNWLERKKELKATEEKGAYSSVIAQ